LEEFEQHIHNNPESKYSALPSVRLPGLFSSENDILHPSLRDPQVVLPTIVSGLKVYFDKALGSNLLYRFERPQYAEIRKRYVTGPTVQVNQEREMSAIYGAEHLLRMIGLSFFSFGAIGPNSTLLPVTLPSMVAGSTMDPESVGLVRDYVTELMT
jgi:mortality factor 4-like protein 1